MHHHYSTQYLHYHHLLFRLPHPHRHPHSFPTRRSSDLALPRRAGIVTSPDFTGPRPPSTSSRGPRGRDRKSTRLNSSHVAISYAVFCLKKKNREIDRT